MKLKYTLNSKYGYSTAKTNIIPEAILVATNAFLFSYMPITLNILTNIGDVKPEKLRASHGVNTRTLDTLQPYIIVL